ncbi:MAG TPA: hypothetical protein VE547_12470, partial [Mycobacteriales bacterium]|nr:hypothetical protein [Mycobacteriales bacterium]
GMPVAPARRRPVWVAHGILVAAYLLLYLDRTDPTGRQPAPATVGDVLALTREAVLDGFLPGLIGGPWRGGYFGSLPPEPGAGAVVVAVVVVAAVVVPSCVARPRAAIPAWLVLAVYLGFDIGLVAGLRLDFIGPAIGRDPRYTADAVVVAALALGFALLPVAGAPATGPVPGRFAGLRAQLAERPPPGPVPASLVLLSAYLASCLITTGLSAQHMERTSGKAYVATARGELARQAGASVWDGPVPDDLMAAMFGRDASASRVFASLRPPPRFDEPTADLRMLDGLGLLRGVNMLAEARSLASPVPDCGYGVQAGRERGIPLNRVTSGRRQVVRIGYYNGRAVPGTVTVDGRTVRVTFQRGLHYVYVVVDGPVRTVDLSVDAAEVGAGFCATDVVVGQPWPKAGA